MNFEPRAFVLVRYGMHPEAEAAADRLREQLSEGTWIEVVASEVDVEARFGPRCRGDGWALETLRRLPFEDGPWVVIVGAEHEPEVISSLEDQPPTALRVEWDPVDLAGNDSFPASDPPAYTR
ncbi:MAG: hypothetical protein AAGA48_20965 [Myxococcota bacterium]